MANFIAFNASWQVTIHKVFTNIHTCFSSLRKCLFSYVHANVNSNQPFFFANHQLHCQNPEFMKCTFKIKLFHYCLGWPFINCSIAICKILLVIEGSSAQKVD